MRATSSTRRFLALAHAGLGLLGLVSGSPNANFTDRPTVFAKLNILGKDLSRNISHDRVAKIKTWSNLFIPQVCRDVAAENGIDSFDMVTFNITYSDCDTPWVFCRHKDSPMTKEVMATQFGRMPVGMRDYVRHVISLPSKSPHAYAVSGQGDLVMFGDHSSRPSLSVWVHETAHCIDRHSGPLGPRIPGDFSSTKKWLDAFEADQAVADYYAKATQVENFAQTAVVALYDKLNQDKGGIYGAGCFKAWRMRNQMLAVQDLLGDKLLQYGYCGRYHLVGISSPVLGPYYKNTPVLYYEVAASDSDSDSDNNTQAHSHDENENDGIGNVARSPPSPPVDYRVQSVGIYSLADVPENNTDTDTNATTSTTFVISEKEEEAGKGSIPDEDEDEDEDDDDEYANYADEDDECECKCKCPSHDGTGTGTARTATSLTGTEQNMNFFLESGELKKKEKEKEKEKRQGKGKDKEKEKDNYYPELNCTVPLFGTN